MPTFETTEQSDDRVSGSLGVLLVNLGTPDAPTPDAVRRYLKQFLWDPRVVDYPRVLWWLILNGIILRIRPSRSAAAYEQVWTDRGSPLLFNSQDLAAAMRSQLPDHVHLELAMTYGSPSIASGLDELEAAGARSIVVLPLYPQYSATTTAAVSDAVSAALSASNYSPSIQYIDQYHDADGYVAAHAANIREYWQQNGRGDTLLLSFHGIPQRLVDNGDPYYEQCLKSADLIASALDLGDSEWSIVFQSRVGREPWLQPYTEEVLTTLGKARMPRVDVVCPGFPVDCLETLEEIAMRYTETFVAAGGGALNYIPALNASDAHAEFLAQLVSS